VANECTDFDIPARDCVGNHRPARTGVTDEVTGKTAVLSLGAPTVPAVNWDTATRRGAALASAKGDTNRALGMRKSEPDTTVAAMPLFHGRGLFAVLLASLASGGCVALPERGGFSAHTFWDDVRAVGATWFSAVPPTAIRHNASLAAGSQVTGRAVQTRRSRRIRLPDARESTPARKSKTPSRRLSPATVMGPV
jgi:acyl-CoA synthetase (AMP-forming)/AMP-acid ligase II